MDCIASSGKGVSLLDTHKHEMTSAKVLYIFGPRPYFVITGMARKVFCLEVAEKMNLALQGVQKSTVSSGYMVHVCPGKN